MSGGSVGLRWSADSDGRLGDDQRGLPGGLEGVFVAPCDRLVVVAVAVLNVPAIRLEAFAHVFAHRKRGPSANGDVVVVIHRDQVPQSQVSCKRSSFRRNPFLKVAVAAKHENPGRDQRLLRRVEPCTQHLRGERHADGVSESRAQRPRCAFHPWSQPDFRMPRSAAFPLTKLLHVLQRQIVACQVQHRILEH